MICYLDNNHSSYFSAEKTVFYIQNVNSCMQRYHHFTQYNKMTLNIY